MNPLLWVRNPGPKAKLSLSSLSSLHFVSLQVFRNLIEDNCNGHILIKCNIHMVIQNESPILNLVTSYTYTKCQQERQVRFL